MIAIENYAISVTILEYSENIALISRKYRAEQQKLNCLLRLLHAELTGLQLRKPEVCTDVNSCDTRCDSNLETYNETLCEDLCNAHTNPLTCIKYVKILTRVSGNIT